MNQAISVFSPQQWSVLQALNTYRFLTVDQMLRLGLSKNAKSIRDKTLFALRHRGLIYSDKIGSFLPDVHYLTPKGASELAAVEKIAVHASPASKRFAFSALFAQHRFAQVDYHIGFRQWVEARGDAEVVLELQDFNGRSKTGQSRFKASTELNVPTLPKPVIPDGVFGVRLFTGPTAIYLAEIHRTTQTKAVTDQLLRYLEVIKSGAVRQAFGYEANPTICSIHTQDAVLEGVKARLMQSEAFQPFKRNFVFQTIEGLRTDMSADWHLADNNPANPFPISNPASDVRQ